MSDRNDQEGGIQNFLGNDPDQPMSIRMDANYYATTMMNAVMKLGPAALYLIAGYILFIKMPFWFMTKVVKENRPNFEEYDAFIAKLEKEKEKVETIKVDGPKVSKSAETKKAESQDKSREKAKSEGSKEKERPKQTEQKQKAAPKEPPKTGPRKLTPEEELFGLAPGLVFTKDELKKTYHKLLRIHHPDKVASLAPHFKSLAEIKTKEINTAYDKLKKKAA